MEEQDSTTQDMQEYLALKQSVKGGIRTAQGRTWRRQMAQVIQERIIQPARDHPGAALGIGATALLGPLIGMTLIFSAPMVIGGIGVPGQGEEGRLFTQTVLKMFQAHIQPVAGMVLAGVVTWVGICKLFER